MLENLVDNAPVFLLVAVRCFALIMTLPLFSSRTVPRMAKAALAGYMAYFIFPLVSLAEGPYAAYSSGFSGRGKITQEYIFYLIGEGLIGFLIGFYINVIFAAFSTAGQFFAFQMGFSASQVFDAMSEVENPLLGEFFNFAAMLLFLQTQWCQNLFLYGLKSSYRVLNVFLMLENSGSMVAFMFKSLTRLFSSALVIALPLMGTLFLINISVGLLAKASPQMNLMSEGFPTLILTSFLLLFTLLPEMCNFFIKSFAAGFKQLEQLFILLSGGGVQ